MTFPETAEQERERLWDKIAQLENRKKTDAALIDQQIRALQKQLNAIHAYENALKTGCLGG